MILEIDDKSYNYVLDLIAQRTELIEKYNVLNAKTFVFPFDEEYLEKLTEDDEEYTDEQLNELMEILDEMDRLRSRMVKINRQIAICVESYLNSYKK